MPEDGFFLVGDYRNVGDIDVLDRTVGDDLDLKVIDDGDAPAVHEIAWDSSLYDLDGEKEVDEVELSLRLSEGDNFKLHLG